MLRRAKELALTGRRWFLAGGLAVLARPAQAHAILLESDPRHQALVPAGERVLRLRFNSRLDRARSRLTLVRPGRVLEVLVLEDGPEDVLAATVRLMAGAHVVRWQVLAIDGHITRGEVPFVVMVG